MTDFNHKCSTFLKSILGYSVASSAGLSMGSSLRMGFEKKISGREACHKSNKMDVSMYLVAVSMYPTP
jgi:hypothetical protein